MRGHVLGSLRSKPSVRGAAFTAVAMTGIQMTNLGLHSAPFILGREDASVLSGSNPVGRAISVMLPTLRLRRELQGLPYDTFLSAGIWGPTYLSPSRSVGHLEIATAS